MSAHMLTVKTSPYVWDNLDGTVAEAMRERKKRLIANHTRFTSTANTITYWVRDNEFELTYTPKEETK